MFSSRLPATLAQNAFSRAVEALRQSGVPLLDLTETNPTTAGVAYPADVLARILLLGHVLLQAKILSCLGWNEYGGPRT